MRRTILLLATMALALLLVGGVAASKQRQEEQSTSPQSPTSDKGSGDVSIESTAVKASFASGSGANFLGVKVSNHGNLLSFESPANQEMVFGGREGYAVCSGGGGTVHGHDTGNVEAGFGAPKFSQPNGAGTFPLTVTRNTTDGKFQLKQVWTRPDPVEKDVTVTMTLKNISSATIEGVLLSRSGDFDVGSLSSDRGARTLDSVWLWDDAFGPDNGTAAGLMLTSLRFGESASTVIETASTWVGDGSPNSGSRRFCGGNDVNTPAEPGDFAMRTSPFLFNFNAGQSKTLKFEYGRM